MSRVAQPLSRDILAAIMIRAFKDAGQTATGTAKQRRVTQMLAAYDAAYKFQIQHDLIETERERQKQVFDAVFPEGAT